jgi:radical SAM superfamily enzyme YgiQ (UPF0313 family)
LRVVLISPYDLGRQPFAVAHLAAHFRDHGVEAVCVDLAQQRLEPAHLTGATFVGVHLGMHTATRLALAVAPRIREHAPDAHLCAYGLYAPMNTAHLMAAGFDSAMGGEYEEAVVARAMGRVAAGDGPGRVAYKLPLRSGLPELTRYARLQVPGGEDKVVGFVHASRGCKHTCRHCPVVPVYEGKFRISPIDVVMGDIEQQVQAGAEHISFGDPDFLNGPRHALRIAEGIAQRWPGMTWDCVIKVEHLLAQREHLPALRDAGLTVVLTAVESVEDEILTIFDKGHTAADFRRVVGLMREVGIGLSPTFVPFSPWTTMEGYLRLLATLVELDLHGAVSPVQLVIRLLIPQGSWLMKLEDMRGRVGAFDHELLGYPWVHEDPAVDALQKRVCDAVGDGAGFETVWQLAHAAMDLPVPPLAAAAYEVPSMSEPWYCCAEPTESQLVRL